MFGRISRLPLNYATDIKAPNSLDIQSQYPILFGMNQQKKKEIKEGKRYCLQNSYKFKETLNLKHLQSNIRKIKYLDKVADFKLNSASASPSKLAALAEMQKN